VREFTKAAISYGWSNTVFQMQQLVNVLAGSAGDGPSATDAFTALTECTVQQLGPTMRATFRAGDAMQRGMVNLMFGSVGLGGCSDARTAGRRGGIPTSSADSPQSSFRLSSRPSASSAPRGVTPSWRDLRRQAAADSAPAYDEAESGYAAEPQGWGPMP
jgi:hypothetical protein